MKKENWKRQTFWSLPVYTGDVSGVCSALYELGGMVIMHDPSGCNSTYNTHDEIRWMDMESLIFLSGLRDIDAITGNDRKLIDDAIEAAEQFHPKFIAIANSPVPWLIGTDFQSICRTIRKETGIPAFHVETNAMHDYTYGAGHAFEQLARMLFEENGAERPTSGDGRIRVNVLGATPLDFTVRSQMRTLREILAEGGFETVSVWGIGDDLETLREAPRADVNLVISSAGLLAAEYLKSRFGIPYAAGIPAGAFREPLLRCLREAAQTGQDRVPYLEVLAQARTAPSYASQSHASQLHASQPRTAAKEVSDRVPPAEGITGSPLSSVEMTGKGRHCFAGEPVTMGSLAADCALREGSACDIVCLTETAEGLLSDADARPQGEAQIREVLSAYGEVTADPMLRHACRADAVFHELPHFAYSGRLYLNRIPALIR